MPQRGLLLLLTTCALSAIQGAPALGAEIDFSGPTNYSTGDGPRGIAAADFNGDGDTDLATANVVTDDVSIFLGASGGTFTGPTSVPLTAGADPVWVVAGQFDGGSDPDLAFASQGSDSVSVLLGGAGATFTGPTDIALGATTDPQELVSGEFNGDSDPDLATANKGTDNVSVLLGGTGGTFGAPTTETAGDEPDSIATGEFNGDSDPDLAVVNFLGNTASILLGAAGGDFSGPTNIPGVAGALLNGATGVAAADFNADADPDLAFSNQGSNNVIVFLGAAGDAFTPYFGAFGAGFLPSSVVATDLDGDGEPDVAVTNLSSNDVTVLLGVPGVSPSFNGPFRFGAHTGPTALAVANFDGDADLDMAVANANSDRVSVLLQTSSSGPAGPGGPQGPQGPQGLQGAQGPPGRDATVICKAKGRGKARPKCIVLLTATASSSRASARLSRNGRTYARGSAFVSEGTSRVPLIATGPMRAGRYLLTVKVSDRDGKVTVTKRRVAVR